MGVAPAPCALGKASRATDRLGCTDLWARRVGCGPRCRLCQLEGAGEKDEGRARPIEVPLLAQSSSERTIFLPSLWELRRKRGLLAWQSGDWNPLLAPVSVSCLCGTATLRQTHWLSPLRGVLALCAEGTAECLCPGFTKDHLVSPCGGG